MKTILEEEITELINRYANTYIENPSVMISAYNNESQTTADYNGRQILELMQNADDAASPIIVFDLNTEEQTLTVSNNGNPFTKEGIESLMFPSLTSKNKTEYIGNKGLGFRSILNWVDSVSILTEGVSLNFSRQISEQYFNNHIANNPNVEQKLQEEKKAKRLEDGVIPIAALAFPEINKEKSEGFVTQIVLRYKKSEEAVIEEQLNQIVEETLLFLNYAKELNIIKNSKPILHLKKKNGINNKITIRDKSWHISPFLNIQYSEQTKYNIIIAWQDDLSDKGNFYNYFSTDVPIGLPCLIHATFDVTNNRKEINDSKENRFILGEIVKILSDIAKDALIKEQADWDAYRFLTPDHSNSRKFFEPFYKQIIEAREGISCYPKCNNKYADKNDVRYHGDTFSNWVVNHGYGKYFISLLLPLGDLSITKVSLYAFEDFAKAVDLLNMDFHFDLDRRVELIKFLLENENGIFNSLRYNNNKKLPLLLNNNGKVVNPSTQIFTKNLSESTYHIPSYIEDIDFISEELYNKIRENLRDEIEKSKFDNEKSDSRAIKRMLDPIINIGSDDIVEVIRFIVRKTNEHLNIIENEYNSSINQTASINEREIILEMVHSFFSIFSPDPQRRNNLTGIDNIPLLTRDGKIRISNDLYFGKEYPDGKNAELVFKDIRHDCDYIAEPAAWQLKESNNNDAEIDLIKSFFTWLNVNVISRHRKKKQEFKSWDKHDDYIDFLLKDRAPDQPNVHKNYEIDDIVGIDDILTHECFKVENLIAWIVLDDKFLKQISNEHIDLFYTTYNSHQTHYKNFTSYLKYKIIKSNILDNVIADIPLQSIEGFKLLNLDNPLFKEIKIKEYQIREVIDKLGITSCFNELTLDQIYTILKRHDGNQGIGTQQLYKTIYDYFRNNENTRLKDLSEPYLKDIEYVCRKGWMGKELTMALAKDVYYSDNQILPQHLLEDYNFIYLPRRMGEDQVAKYFGVKLIKDIAARLKVTNRERHKANNEFKKYINSLKPYMLAYRLENIKTDRDKRTEANSIKHLNIELMSDIQIESEGKIIELNNCEFLPEDRQFLLRFNDDESLDKIKENSFLCDAIAEIISITFRVNDLKNTFRRIFKDGTKESKHIIQTDEKEELLLEAMKLLGISKEEQDFWKKLLKFNDEWFEDENYKYNIENKIGVSLPDNYSAVDFSNLGNEEGIYFLRWLLDNKSDCNLENLIQEDTLLQWHTDKLFDAMRDVRDRFDKLLWYKFNNSNNRKEQERFADTKLSFENLNNSIKERFVSQNRFELTPNYGQFINNYALNEFGVDLSDSSCDKINNENLYIELFNKYDVGIFIEDKEKELREKNQNVYSLLFFEGHEEIIQECLRSILSDIKTNDDINNQSGDNSYQLITAKMHKNQLNTSYSKSNNHTGSVTTRQTNRKLLKGIRAELKVLESLKNEGYEVRHISKQTDSKHYDIEYKAKNSDNWRFLEVKSDSGGFFYLSEHERNTAIEYADKYDIAVVSDTKVYLIKNPFKFNNNEDFNNNSVFVATPSDYKISFMIEGNEELD